MAAAAPSAPSAQPVSEEDNRRGLDAALVQITRAVAAAVHGKERSFARVRRGAVSSRTKGIFCFDSFSEALHGLDQGAFCGYLVRWMHRFPVTSSAHGKTENSNRSSMALSASNCLSKASFYPGLVLSYWIPSKARSSSVVLTTQFSRYATCATTKGSQTPLVL